MDLKWPGTSPFVTAANREAIVRNDPTPWGCDW